MKDILVTIGLSLLIILGYYVGRAYFLKPKLVQGQKAFEIVDKLSDGNKFALSELKGKYVLLDFWGTWCSPCLESHPKLVQLYHRFHGQSYQDATDFEIVSIAVETNGRNWLNIIREDQLSWPYHLLQTQLFNSPIVKTYNVKQLPTKFLINPEGVIIAVDPSMSHVINILQSKLNAGS